MAMQTEIAYQAPPSPTLTNPDMILPDIDYGRSDSPDDHSDALIMWKNVQMGDLDFSLPPSQYLSMNMGNMGLNIGSQPITPTTPIIYGNGTMLSDIGEVTEAESIAGRNSRPSSPMVPRMTSRAALRAGAVDSSNQPYQSIKAKARMMAYERRSSIDSTSTIKTNEHAVLFADFDDSASVDDRDFQGDDEESVAESYNEDIPAFRRRNPLGLQKEEDRLSQISIGRRAEEILANAKRRLTTMEGNLNRARSSLYITTDGSVDSDSLTPSPPLRSGSTLDNLMSPPVTQQGHNRMNSDQSLSPDSQFFPRRAASALGAAGGYRHLSNSQSTNDLSKSSNKRDSSESFQGMTTDDNMSVDSGRNSGHNYLSPNSGIFSDRGLTRSTSAMQMRDIKDQVEGLKDKVSALREQARADSLKRQSITSLRIPSPFTHSVVDQWYAQKTLDENDSVISAMDRDGAATPTGNRPHDKAWSGKGFASLGEIEDDEEMSPVNVHALVHDLEDSQSHSEYEDAEGMLTPVNRPGTPVTESRAYEQMIQNRLGSEIDDDMRTEDGYSSDEGAMDYESDSGESTYHDAELPLSHEDREDAFDYEHFFLHSAMGTISQQRLERRGSFSSETSVETTRGPPLPSIARHNSTESISTMASFETATEGRLSKLKRNNSDDMHSRSVARTSDETFISADEDIERIRPATAHATRRPATSYQTSGGSDGLAPRPASSMSSLNNAASRAAVIHRPVSTSAYQHRLSVSSFDSTGTNRLFPLVNNKNRLSLILPKNRGRAQSAGIPTPRDSPNAEDEDKELMDLRDHLLHNATSMMSINSPSVNGEGFRNDPRRGSESAMGLLHKDDQALVEQLVTSFGQCVLKLSEVSRASVDSRILRQRMLAAKKILEGIDEQSPPGSRWANISM